jgi:hypothetical protein
VFIYFADANTVEFPFWGFFKKKKSEHSEKTMIKSQHSCFCHPKLVQEKILAATVCRFPLRLSTAATGLTHSVLGEQEYGEGRETLQITPADIFLLGFF